MEQDIIPVTKVNWANCNIHRSGIIPICIENNRKWIGLGVNKFSANLTVIGGSYENEDHDLLETAYRELKEEVNDNLDTIVVENLYSCWAIQSDYSISIILPVSKCCFNFRPTEELYDIIWVTPKQLKVMARNQNFLLSKTGKTKAYSFSMDLRLIAEKLANVVDEGQWIQKSCITKFIRPKRLNAKVAPQIHKTVEAFIVDTNEYKAWGNTSLVLTKNKIALMRTDKTIYILSTRHIPEIIKGLNKVQTKTNVSLTSDLDNTVLSKLVSQIRISSIESDMNRVQKSFVPYAQKLKIIRNLPRKNSVMEELNLILDQEKKLYEYIQQNGIFFNTRRAAFLKDINRVNHILKNNNNKMSVKKLQKKLNVVCTCDNIDLMIKTGFIKHTERQDLVEVR